MKHAEDFIRAIALGWVDNPKRAARAFLDRHEGRDLTTDEGREEFVKAAEAMAEQGYDVRVVR